VERKQSIRSCAAIAFNVSGEWTGVCVAADASASLPTIALIECHLKGQSEARTLQTSLSRRGATCFTLGGHSLSTEFVVTL